MKIYAAVHMQFQMQALAATQNSLPTAVWGYLVERRSNRCVEAEQQQCENILNSLAAVTHKNKRSAADNNEKVVHP